MKTRLKMVKSKITKNVTPQIMKKFAENESIKMTPTKTMIIAIVTPLKIVNLYQKEDNNYVCNTRQPIGIMKITITIVR